MILKRLFHSTIGKKIIMAVTGLLLFGFVIIHMLGNWQVFSGSEALNEYAVLLKSKAAILWGFRFGLLGLVILHIWAAITLTLANRAAAPEKYADAKSLGTTWASRTMTFSGVVVLGFIIFHILHFTVRTIPGSPEYFQHDEKGRHDVYAMVVHAYRNPLIVTVYVVCVGLLCFHLSHGLQSMFRSLGLSDRRYLPLQIWFARAFAAFIFLGMSAVPISIFFNLKNF
ncbi:MAG: succinate dehydrogenase cytochrome b subunit [Verrucomicrobiota bacterium]